VKTISVSGNIRQCLMGYINSFILFWVFW